MTDEPARPAGDAITAQAFVVRERGEWVVVLDVFYWDEVIRHRIQTYPTRRQAEVAAHWIERSARRDLSAGPTGF
ncbi:MAG: hypothetical protein JNL73_02805 [Anaerolineales bacterium]|nr:hypothetical protein [Anaerolineales bacterium]